MTARHHSLTPTTQKEHDMTQIIRTLTDSDGNEFSLVYYGQSSHDTAPRIYVEICAEGELIAAGPFTPEALHAALDEVAPAGSDTLTRSLRNDRHYWQGRAEKAEKERDEARRHECSDLDAHWRLDETLASLKEANATVASLRAENPRPLTADDIESVLHSVLPLSTEHLGADDIADIASDLYAALTEPPRPEGAEELARLIATADVGEWDCGDLADALLATGRVRVVPEEQQ